MNAQSAPATRRSKWSGVISHYRDRLPSVVRESPVTLFEGNTPLLPAPRLAEALGVRATVLLKCEGVNPTGSFKDRGMTVAVTTAKHTRAKRVICASTGNTAASAAAYAARAGLQAVVVIPRGNVAEGKLAQSIVHGATIVQIDDNFDRALEIVRQLADEEHTVLVNSTNPHRLEGQKTAAFEVCDALGDAPDYHFLPVGNAGNITAYWMGYREYLDDGIVGRCPRMMGYQAAGAAPLVHGHPVDQPDTFATAIRIGNPASWNGAELARDRSGGTIDDVADDEIRAAYELVARTEGVFVEPASAAGLAGLRKFNARSPIDERATIVCTVTGHGLKDPASASETKHEIFRAPADVQHIRTLIER